MFVKMGDISLSTNGVRVCVVVCRRAPVLFTLFVFACV